MDGTGLTEEETKGRNTWLLWNAGDQIFCDRMAQQAHCLSDLLKTIDSRQHNMRFRDLSLVNPQLCNCLPHEMQLSRWVKPPQTTWMENLRSFCFKV